MNLKDLAAKPQLIKITIDDEDIVKEYGEPLDFWTWDRQPMDVFLKIAGSQGKDYGVILETVKNLVLDESGQPLMVDDVSLPGPVLMQVINKIIDILGK